MQAHEVESEVAREIRLLAIFDRWRAALAAAPAFDRSSPVPTWLGLAIAGAGFAVLAYGWGRVAGLASVALQVPYLISAGCTGLGLIVVGSAVVAVQAKRREAAAREEILVELGRVVREVERLASGTRAEGE